MSNALFKTSTTLPPILPQAQIPVPLQVELCSSDRPLALLPVRLETRFIALPNSSYELRVRVYPDKIHIDSHEAQLTPSELEWGKHYWEQNWRAADQTELQANAWRQLADRFDAARAAWIVRVLRPMNAPEDRPETVVAPDRPLPRPILFPTVATTTGDNKDVSWRRAPLARLLPERWIAIGYSAGQVAFTATGKDIRRPLAVGPDPCAAPATPADDQLAVDEGMRWMVDFDAAETAGMGLRIPVSTALASAGIDTLLVLGVMASTAPSEVANQLGQLLDAHHYTDGLSFLDAGVPTNNTEEARSGHSDHDAGRQRSFAAEMTRVEDIIDPDTNARQLGRALGLASDAIPNVLGRIPSSTHRHSLNLRSMNTALWSGTWGYFLSNMIGLDETGLTADSIGWAREHFTAHVRSFGPFAAIRAGRQPYGVLPVTSLDFWTPPSNDQTQEVRDAWLRGLLMKLRDTVWRGNIPSVPRLGRTSDPATDLAAVMRTDAQSSTYVARALLGRHYLLHLRAFMLQDLQMLGWLSSQDTLTHTTLNDLAIAWRPRLAGATYEDSAWKIGVPLVQAEIAAQRALEPNYITALLAEPTIQQIFEDHAQSGEEATLLHALLRHCALLEYTNAAAAILSSQGPTHNGQDTRFTTLIRNPELVNLLPGSQPTMTWARQLEQVVPAVTGNKTLRAHLEGLQQFDTPPVAALGAFRRSLAHLQSLDSESLQHLTQGTLDLASHRLDAWITSLATKRLSAMRSAQPQGLYVGAYAWVENLKPGAVAPPVAAPAGEPGPIVAQPDDTGFIHAPSLAHAATAALLRNAHLGHANVATTQSPFAIDLSSRRIREAETLLDGVRQGQPLGALLGYRFERRLREMFMDRFTHFFRSLAPLASDRLSQPGQPLDTIGANNVVDGLLLHRKWRTVRAQLQALIGTSFPAVERELIALGESIDALGDALTAETAYQLVRGNTSRTASTLQSISRGDAPPPELEVARTPRSGMALTQRVVVLFDGETKTGTWADDFTSPRATAEPLLNAWAAGLLGDPGSVRCVIERLADEGDEVVETRELWLSELQLSPLDLIFSVDVHARSGTLTELEQHVMYHARRTSFDASARLRIRDGRPSDWSANELTLHDLLQQARAVRRVLARARALDASDLDLPERDTSDGVDLAELTDRALTAEQELQAAHDELQTLLETSAAADAENLRTAIVTASRFGVASAVPLSATGDDAAQRAILSTQVAAIAKELQARIDQGASLRELSAADSSAGTRDQLLNRLRAVFGGSFVVLPRFACANATELASARAATVPLQGGDPLAACTWFTRCERVREPLTQLGAALRGAEVLGNGERLELSVAQLPFAPGDRWVALPTQPGQSVPAGRLSLVVQSTQALDPKQPLAGLLIDEWVEVVPNKRETTAITFQFNPPDVCAPQSILLAVPPVPGKSWTAWDLQRVLMETLDLAKLRAVEPQALGKLGQYLPALYFGFNANDAAVSTDFGPLTH